jgi:HK97 family phage major capsid protein
MSEIKNALDDLQRANEEFKSTLTKRVDELAKAGVVHPDTQAKLDRVAAAMDEYKSKADEAHKRETEMKSLLDAQDLRLQKLAAMGVDAKNDGLTPEQREQKNAFLKYVRKGDQALTSDEFKAMSVGSDPDGGYLVSPDMSGKIVTKIFDTSNIRAIASIQTISTDALEGRTDVDDADAGWVTETGTRSATTSPQVGKWRIPVHELYAMPEATQKLLDDAGVDVESWLTGKVSSKFSRTEETSFVSGDGAGKPRGFTTYTTATTVDDSRAWGTMQHVATAANGSFGTDPTGVNVLLQVIGALKPHYLPGARFVMSRITQTKARQLTDASSAGKYVFVPSFQAGVPNTLLGYPITIADDMPAYTTTDALAVAFGNFAAGYQIVDRHGIRVLRDPYTNKPYVRFYAIKRVGGDVVDFEAIKFLKFGS